MVSVVVFEFGGMRCQPLRRALAERRIYCVDRSNIVDNCIS
ncbi:acetyltransferase [Vibrio cholerae]